MTKDYWVPSKGKETDLSAHAPYTVVIIQTPLRSASERTCGIVLQAATLVVTLLSWFEDLTVKTSNRSCNI